MTKDVATKRYVITAYPDDDHDSAYLDVTEDPDGEWVLYEDIKRLLPPDAYCEVRILRDDNVPRYTRQDVDALIELALNKKGADDPAP